MRRTIETKNLLIREQQVSWKKIAGLLEGYQQKENRKGLTFGKR